jgi:NADPH-dependent 2,4-dienoyl-CoA reductase/sulfur reductase-like enzyme
MAHYPYLIIGGGMAADAAVRGIRELDADRSIGLIGDEVDAPYSRPPLSKGLWKGKALESVWRKTAERGADLHLGRRATALSLQGKQVIDHDGREHTFAKLLIVKEGP